MDDQRRRDDVIERELSRAFRARTGASDAGPHVDAEAAAAWMERRLGEPEARAVESHLSSCADCQALMATLARVTPEPEVAGGAAWWRSLRRPWLVPAAAAAAVALVIWVALPAPAPAPRLESMQALRVAPPEPPPLPADPIAPETAQGGQTAARLERKAEAAAPAAPAREFAKSVDEARRAPEAAADRAVPPALGDTTAPPAPPPPAPSAAAPALAPPPATSANAEGARAQDTVDLRTAKRTDAAEAATPPSEREERASAAPTRQAFARGAVSALARARGLMVVAADGGGRWRRAGAAIEFAPAASAAFTPVTLPLSPDTVVAGAAPGGRVCWLVGSNGTVLHTSNGTTFSRVSTPAAVYLVDVAATDARTATVTAADGRRFLTTDQGTTWTELRETK